MGERVDEIKYEAMIASLRSFATNVSNAADELGRLASTCVQAIGDEDKAVGEISDKIREAQEKYKDATEQATNIANAMQLELDEQRKEDLIWAADL